jgi:hypothetical protein
VARSGPLRVSLARPHLPRSHPLSTVSQLTHPSMLTHSFRRRHLPWSQGLNVTLRPQKASHLQCSSNTTACPWKTPQSTSLMTSSHNRPSSPAIRPYLSSPSPHHQAAYYRAGCQGKGRTSHHPHSAVPNPPSPPRAPSQKTFRPWT